MNSETPVVPVTSPTSLSARMLNVVASPAEVFEEVRDTPYQAANWWVPMTLAAMVGLVFVLVAFAQPGVVEEIMRQQVDAFDRAVEAGKMKEADAEAAREGMEKMQPMIALFGRIFGGAGAVLGTFAAGFATAFVLWLVARKGLKSPIRYWKCMEVIGLSNMVSLIGTILTLFLVVYRGSLSANLSPAMLISEIRPGTPVFTLLSALNPIFLWWAGVVALGLARLTGKSWGVAAAWVYGLYLAFSLLFAGLGLLWS